MLIVVYDSEALPQYAEDYIASFRNAHATGGFVIPVALDAAHSALAKPGGADGTPLSDAEWAGVRKEMNEVLLSGYRRRLALLSRRVEKHLSADIWHKLVEEPSYSLLMQEIFRLHSQNPLEQWRAEPGGSQGNPEAHIDPETIPGPSPSEA